MVCTAADYTKETDLNLKIFSKILFKCALVKVTTVYFEIAISQLIGYRNTHWGHLDRF